MAQQTEVQSASEPIGAGSLQLIVVGPETTQIINVGPKVQRLKLGRHRESDVVLSDSLVSERHAVIHFAGDPPQLEDAGSTNGTWIGRDKLGVGVPVVLPIGVSVQLGNTTLLVRRSPRTLRPRKVWTHHQLMSRTEQECEKERSTFAILRIRVPLTGEQLAQTLERWLLPGDLLGHLAGNDYHALLLEVSSPEADRRCREISEELGRHARIGLAKFAKDGHTADKLVAVASRNCLGDPGAQVIVASPAMKDLYKRAERVAAAQIDTVLLGGETGTGKELLARFIHDRSPRSKGPFVAVNCSILAPSLAPSLLFGHVKGAYTGAQEDKAGFFEDAQGGTLFLDDIQNLLPDVQPMLLRVLQERNLRRVGAPSHPLIPLDLRVIAASNRDLKTAAAEGSFALDLYHRLGSTLTIPPLRHRSEDIVPLAQEFLAVYSARERRSLRFTGEALERLTAYTWPGNVRQLKAVIEELVIQQDGPDVDPDGPPLSDLRDTLDSDPPRGERVDLGSLNPAVARRLVLDTLIECYCYKSRAAAKLGLSKRTLIDWMKKLDIPVPPPKRDADPT